MIERPSHRRQVGAALLLMMLMVLVAGSAVLLSKLNANAIRTVKLSVTQSALAEARNALIHYATVYPDFVAGEAAQLPCPDVDGSGSTIEGEAHTGNCGGAGVNVMGRLPWRTLGIDALKDSSGECLWYIVSGSYKSAAGTTATMINSDSSGQLRLYQLESGNIIEGEASDNRPIAMVIAPMEPLEGQVRQLAGTNQQCNNSFQASAFLEADASSGVSNPVLSGVADTLDDLIMASGRSSVHNDRIATITPADLVAAIAGRPDFDVRMRQLGLTIAECVANYARGNPGGTDDRRLPWPAPVSMADYRSDAAYDDINVGVLSGRLPNVVDESNTVTGNGLSQILNGCDSSVVVQWSADTFSMWQNWKDHFFYVVAESYEPGSVVPNTCSACLSVNGSGQYAAIVIFSNVRLPSLNQVRNAPPIDTDTKDQTNNYLEGANTTNLPYGSGTADFASQAPSNNFNDILFCIDEALAVTEC